VYDAAIKIKGLVDDTDSMMPDAVRTQLAGLAVEALFAASCLASETAEGSDKWQMLNVCKRHSSDRTFDQSEPSQ
jgi:hypothetical protein